MKTWNEKHLAWGFICWLYHENCKHHTDVYVSKLCYRRANINIVFFHQPSREHSRHAWNAVLLDVKSRRAWSQSTPLQQANKVTQLEYHLRLLLVVSRRTAFETLILADVFTTIRMIYCLTMNHPHKHIAPRPWSPSLSQLAVGVATSCSSLFFVRFNVN